MARSIATPLTQPVLAGETVSGSTLYFRPAPDWNGTTSFQYAGKTMRGALDPSSATATISITPVVDVTTLTLSATPAVAEGGSIAHSAAVSAPAASALVLTLSNGAVINNPGR